MRSRKLFLAALLALTMAALPGAAWSEPASPAERAAAERRERQRELDTI